MPALRYDLIVDQGADYRRTIPVLRDDGQPVETLDGWQVAGQIRAGYASTTVLHQLDVTVSGTDVLLRIPAAVSSTWAFRLARYDLELQAPDGTTTRLVEGSVVVRPEITRVSAPSLDSFLAVFAPIF